MRDLLQFANPSLTPIDWTNPVTDDPLNDGLVARYLADMSQWGSPIWRDLLGHHGTLTNMEPATDWRTPQGRPGGLGALNFDGTDEYVDTGHNFTEVSDANRLTIRSWSKYALTSQDYIVGERAEGNDGFALNIRGDVGGDPLVLTVSGGFDQTSGASGMSANTWHLVCVTYDQANVVFYVDGQQISSHAQTAAIDESDLNAFLGALNNQGTPALFLGGLLDDIRIYSRALPGAEVERLYDDSRLGSPRTVNRSAWIVPAPASAAPAAGHNVQFMPLLGVA